MSLAAGTHLGPYAVTGQLGAGGMGEVWRATDTRLGRDVALKVLPDSFAADPERHIRFEREAKALAAVNHPNIATLYGLEHLEEKHVLVMELIEGETLREAITSRNLPANKAAEVARQVAVGLAAAHEKGIIHRDLKPENIVLTRDGRVKILDFGLAARVETEPSSDSTAVQTMSRQTQPGTVMGTVGYMSPEQVRGLPLDQRTDIFSFGAILYELLSGRRAFKHESSIETMSAILRDDPLALGESGLAVSATLDGIVRRCLEKSPEARFHSASDLAFALEQALGSGSIAAFLPSASVATQIAGARRRPPIGWLGAGVLAIALGGLVALDAGGLKTRFFAGHAASARSVAVLPFLNMSSDADQEYFADGVSEELLNLLAKVPQLRVAARTSSFSFKGKDIEVPEIARRLNVAHVLEGSVRKSGKQVRITVQLIRADNGFHVWSETYDRTLDDIFAVQDEIAADVVRELRLKLLEPVPTARVTDPRAYALYLQAREVGRLRTAEAYAESDALYRQALEIDPSYAPAWTGLATNATNENGLGVLSFQESVRRSREALGKALVSDPGYAPAHAWRGALAMYFDQDLAAAAREFVVACELDPTDLGIMNSSALLLWSLGRLEESIAVREHIVARDPVNVTARFNLGMSYQWAGRFEEAAAELRTAIRLSPEMGGAHYGLAMTLLLSGDASTALEEMQRESSDPWRRLGRAMATHALGRTAESDAELAEMIKKYGDGWPYNIASVFAFCGDSDRAFEWLDKAAAVGDTGLAEIPVERLFTSLHQDPRWLPFLRRIGKAPEQLAMIPFTVALPAPGVEDQT